MQVQVRSQMKNVLKLMLFPFVYFVPFVFRLFPVILEKPKCNL